MEHRVFYVKQGSTVKQFNELPVNYTQLEASIQLLFPNIAIHEIQFVDADNDCITISNGEELALALQTMEHTNNHTFIILGTAIATEKKVQDKQISDYSSTEWKNTIKLIAKDACMDSAKKSIISLSSSTHQSQLMQSTVPIIPIDNSTSKIIHENIRCNNCMSVIIGPRYKCTSCKYFDLCSKCESQRIHSHHSFYKINSPLQESFLADALATYQANNTLQFLKKNDLYKSMAVNNSSSATKFQFNIECEPSKPNTLNLIFYNASYAPWPDSMCIYKKSGSIPFTKAKIEGTLQPGNSKEVKLVIVAPSCPGKHVGKFILAFNDKGKLQAVGRSIIVNLVVKAASQEIKWGSLANMLYEDESLGSFEECYSAVKSNNGDVFMSRKSLIKNKGIQDSASNFQ